MTSTSCMLQWWSYYNTGHILL